MGGQYDLWRDLQDHVGTFGLVVGDRASEVLGAIAARAGIPALRVSYHLTVTHPQGWRSPGILLDGHSILSELEVLFSPAVAVDPLRLLATLARRRPVVAAWPGVIAGDRAGFSEPGRQEHYDAELPRQAVVVRTVPASFPDQVPYEVERRR